MARQSCTAGTIKRWGMIEDKGFRPVHVRQSVFEAVRVWKSQQKAVQDSGSYPDMEAVLQPIPRREQSTPPDERKLWIPLVESAAIKISSGRSLRRLLTWLWVILRIWLGDFFDKVLRKDSPARSAVRFRKALERAGGTFVKLGQQLAMRVDLLPWDYCVELSKMLDRMAPFPVEEALQEVERTLKRPWQDVFAVFDPAPVGSASLACVYQAILKDGAKVVVKVRRPGIRELFVADLQVLDWLSRMAEFLTIIRPGFTR